jgi:hypothetical protein
MTSLPKREFTAEFRSQALKLVREGGVPRAEGGPPTEDLAADVGELDEAGAPAAP